MKKRYILFYLCFFAIIAEAKSVHKEQDSLLRVMLKQPFDTTRWETMSKIIKIEQQTEKCIHYADQLLNESTKYKNNKYACLACYYHVVYYYNKLKRDSVSKWLSKMEDYLPECHMWDYYFDGKRFHIAMYSFEERYEYVIDQSFKMYHEAKKVGSIRGQVAAYQCLATAYFGSKRWNEGIKALENAYKMLSEKDNPIVRISVLSQLISISNDRQNYAMQLKYLHELEKLLINHINNSPGYKKGYSDIYLFLNVHYANYYIANNSLDVAFNYLKKAEKLQNNNSYFMSRAIYFDALANYYKQKKSYTKAISYIDSTLKIIGNKSGDDYTEELLQKARLFLKIGEDHKALKLYETALSMKDSAATNLSNTQMEQIKSDYELEKIELEQTKLHNDIYFLGLSIIIIILIAAFVLMYHIIHIRKKLRKSELEIRNAADITRKANEIKTNFFSELSYNVRTPLNNVVGFSQVIANEEIISKELREEYASIINRSSTELITLVNDVLDLSRLEAHKMKFQIQKYDMVLICKEALFCLKSQNNQSHLHVTFNTDIESHVVLTDVGRIAQSLISTISYPHECDIEREIDFSLTYSKDHQHLCFCITNSPLADKTFASQATSIRNDINLLLWRHFGGTYEVNPKGSTCPTIVFTYPANQISE